MERSFLKVALIALGFVAFTTAAVYPVLPKPGWSEWSQWSNCSAPCGGGTQTRTRVCPSRPKHGPYGLEGKCKGLDKETRKCNEQLCPVPGGWSEWSPFGACSQTCKSGTPGSQTRTRTCTNPPPSNGGADCTGLGSESRDCTADIECPVNGVWSEWSPFDTCSKTCKTGTQTRTRTCTNPPPSNGGADCSGLGSESQDCNADIECPVPGGWTEWSPFGTCSKTCKTGTQTRTRTCTNPPPSNGGADCSGSGSDSQDCNADVDCPVKVDGNWGAWGSWSEWSNWAGHPIPTRTRTRTRACDSPAPAFGGKPCEGPSSEKQTQKCKKYGSKCTPY